MSASARESEMVAEAPEADDREVRSSEDRANDGASGTSDARQRTGAHRGFAWLLVITAALGLLGSFVITTDKFELLADPGFVPACSLSAWSSSF
jgi:hypothetical protein